MAKPKGKGGRDRPPPMTNELAASDGFSKLGQISPRRSRHRRLSGKE